MTPIEVLERLKDKIDYAGLNNCNYVIETSDIEAINEALNNESEIFNMASCMLSILDSLKLFDQNSLDTSNETLSEIMFRKMKAYNIDLNKELGFTHLKPVPKLVN